MFQIVLHIYQIIVQALFIFANRKIYCYINTLNIFNNIKITGKIYFIKQVFLEPENTE